MLEKDLLEGLQPHRQGRFRNFLLVSLKRYVSNQRRSETSVKRGGKDRVLSIDCQSADQRFRNEPAHDLTPEKASNAGLPVEDALRIGKEICLAVKAAHEQGILHRDIKPENILFTSDDPAAQIKVADFGIAKLINPEHKITSTVTGWVAGTPFYMAPEQGQGLVESDYVRRSDVYSIGVVIYEMLTGRLPLGRFPAPSKMTSCGTGIDEAVFGALENQQHQRTASAAALAEQLDQARVATTWKMLVVWFCIAALILGMAYWFWNGLRTDAAATNPTASPASATIDEEQQTRPPQLEEAKPPALENPFLKEWPDEDEDEEP